MVWNDGTARAASNAARTLHGSLTIAATTWWMTRLTYYETVTKRGLILHPRDIRWGDVYLTEFVPEMRLLGYQWKLPATASSAAASELQCVSCDDDGGTRGSEATSPRMASRRPRQAAGAPA